MSSENYSKTVNMTDLDKVIKAAKRKRQYFYIGVAGESGHKPEDAMRQRESGGHHADKKAKKIGSVLHGRTHTRLLKETSTCRLEKALIDKYREDPLCLNAKIGQDNCITTDKGIVYVRTYDQSAKAKK